MSGERGNASIYADDPTAVMTADRIDALWRVAERHVPADADDVDVCCALLASFALRRGLTPGPVRRVVPGPTSPPHMG